MCSGISPFSYELSVWGVLGLFELYLNTCCHLTVSGNLVELLILGRHLICEGEWGKANIDANWKYHDAVLILNPTSRTDWQVKASFA